MTLRLHGSYCRQCGCSDSDCHQCWSVLGMPCVWIQVDLCSACAFSLPLVEAVRQLRMRTKHFQKFWARHFTPVEFTNVIPRTPYYIGDEIRFVIVLQKQGLDRRDIVPKLHAYRLEKGRVENLVS